MSAATKRRRRIRRLRRAFVALVLIAPALFQLGCDFVRRGKSIVSFDAKHAMGYWASVAGGTLFWALLVYGASARRGVMRFVGPLVFLPLFVLTMGVQGAYYSIHRMYQSIDASYFAEAWLPTVYGNLPVTRGDVAIHFLFAACVALGVTALAQSVVRVRRRWRVVRFSRLFAIVPPLILIGWAHRIPVSYRTIQATSPDLIFLNGTIGRLGDGIKRSKYGDVILARAQRRTPLPVPKLTAAPKRPRNVILLLQEAQRADVTCVAYDPECKEANLATNPLLPKRLPFYQVRAAASSTAVAISNLWSGVDPTSSKKVIHSAPLLWDFAHAAGYDTAYWTSQNLMFSNSGLYVQDLPLTRFAGGTNINPSCDILIGANDDALSELVIKDLDTLKEPFFAVVHYSNIHHPRRFDPGHAPFKPWDKMIMKGSAAYRNFYKNTVYLSDMAVAKVVEHVQKRPFGARTVLVYTSDHGEAQSEHNNENLHSPTVYDEEIRVPLWIDAPEGALSPDERLVLKRSSYDWIYQYDIHATIVDLLGLWDLPEMKPFRARFIGHPLTRPHRTTGPVPLTNVSWVWEYYLPNWGIMMGTRKIFAGPENDHYECYDLLTDPLEQHELPEYRCRDLIEAADARYRMMPKDLGHLNKRPRDWGLP